MKVTLGGVNNDSTAWGCENSEGECQVFPVCDHLRVSTEVANAKVVKPSRLHRGALFMFVK